jgi:predicted RNA-binding protein with PIN domain
MSPLRRHGGGRPRAAVSTSDVAERWGITERAARRLARRHLSDEVMAILACDSRRHAAAQRQWVVPQGTYSGGMRALGMRSRMPAGRA